LLWSKFVSIFRLLYAFVHKGAIPEAEKLEEEQPSSKMDESVDAGSHSLDAVEILQKFCEQPCEKLSDEFVAEKEPEVSEAFCSHIQFYYLFISITLLYRKFGSIYPRVFESDLGFT